MPVVFQGQAGRVKSIKDSSATGTLQLARIESDGTQISYAQHSTIITGLGISANSNHQFLHTIGNDVYVYVFGDRMGEVIVNGLSFIQDCDLSGNGKHGFELLFEWYNNNKLATRKAPVRVTIGSATSFDGFAIALTGGVKDAETRIIQFQLTLSLLPDAIVG